MDINFKGTYTCHAINPQGTVNTTLNVFKRGKFLILILLKITDIFL